MDRFIFLDMDETLVSSKPLESQSTIDMFSFPEEMLKHPGDSISVRFAKAKMRRHYFNEIKAAGIGALKQYARESGEGQGMRMRIFKFQDEYWVTKLRPQVKAFISALKDHFDKVYIMTAGGYEFQNRVLSVLGVRGMLDGVYSTVDNMHETPKRRDSILVDNLSQDTLSIAEKMMGIGVITKSDFNKALAGKRPADVEKRISKHFVRATNFYGTVNTDPNGLQDAYDKVLRLIGM